jgi:oxygen-dependent protoporphyrinogen oxidase
MRLQRHVPLLKSTLKRVSVRSSLSLLPSRWSNRHYASSSAADPERIAILGGGISGLSTAHFVGKEFPNSKITIYEGQKEAGGWLRSRRVEVPGGDVVFEYGPRSLRPGIYSYPTAQIVSIYIPVPWCIAN